MWRKVRRVVKAKWPNVTSVRPLVVRTAGGNRTHYTPLSRRGALSIELQLKAPPEKSVGLSVFYFSIAILALPESKLRS